MNLQALRPRALGAAAMPVLLAGCISLPADHGRGEVDQWLGARGREISGLPAPGVDDLAREALREPLQPEGSVRVALMLNPDVRATYARLGLGAADLHEAGRLSNPRLSASLLQSSISGERLTLSLVQSFTDLLLLRSRSRVGRGQFVQLQQSVAGEVLALAARAQESHFRLAAAQQVATMRELVASTAAHSAELAERFHAAGNITQLELARERAAASEARLAALAAQAEVTAARGDHARLLGVPVAIRWSVAQGLPAPLSVADDLDALQSLAQASRLDLAAARGRVHTLAAELGSVRRGRWLGDLAVGVEREREADGERLTGPTLQAEVPLFNLRSGPVLRAASELNRSRAQLAGLELDVANEVQLAHARMLAARTRAEEFRTVLIPAREAIVARTQEEQNYMLVGQFELLAAKQAEYDAYGAYLESVRDYWIARVQLEQAVGTRLPGSPQAGRSLPQVEIPAAGEQKPQEDEPARRKEREEDEHAHHGTTGGAP